MVVFARRIATIDDWDTLASSLVNSVEAGVVLTTTDVRPRRLVVPREYRVLHLAEVMRIEDDGFVLDKPLIVATMKSTAAGRRKRTGPGRPSERDLILRIHEEGMRSGLAAGSKSAESRRIAREIGKHHPGSDAPGVSTIRNILAQAMKAPEPIR